MRTAPPPLLACCDDPPQARHHFTLADQVNQLVGASEADPDLGFMARTMALHARLASSSRRRRVRQLPRWESIRLVYAA